MKGMNNLLVLSDNRFGNIRCMVVDGKPWVVGRDVVKALGLKKVTSALSSHVDKNDKMIGIYPVEDEQGRKRFPTWINKYGVYALTHRTKSPLGTPFRIWFHSEIKRLFETPDENGKLIPEELISLDDLDVENFDMNQFNTEMSNQENYEEDFVEEPEYDVEKYIEELDSEYSKTSNEDFFTDAVDKADNNEVQFFRSRRFGDLKVIYENGTVWFCASDACRMLGYVNFMNALKEHCAGNGIMNRLLNVDGINQVFVYVTELNLYRLINHSKVAAAQGFEKWVFEEILPTVRKTDMSATDKAQLDYWNNPENFAQRMNILESVVDNTVAGHKQTIATLQSSIDTLSEANVTLGEENKSLIEENIKLQEEIANANQMIEKLKRRLRYGASAMEFTRWYGNSSLLRPVTYYAQDVGLAPITMNAILVSFGILREIHFKDGKMYRCAQNGWERYVRQPIKYISYINEDGTVEKYGVDENLSSPGWITAFKPAIIGFFSSRGLLDENGKFKKDIWERARREEVRYCKANNCKMQQAWARKYFPSQMMEFEDLDKEEKDLILYEPPKLRPVFLKDKENEEEPIDTVIVKTHVPMNSDSIKLDVAT